MDKQQDRILRPLDCGAKLGNARHVPAIDLLDDIAVTETRIMRCRARANLGHNNTLNLRGHVELPPQLRRQILDGDALHELPSGLDSELPIYRVRVLG